MSENDTYTVCRRIHYQNIFS